MSTRTAKDPSVLHQCRYASAPEFERGLIANLVAKRATLLDDQADRELVWFIQYLSHQPGGLADVATNLLEQYADRWGTASMAASGKSVPQNFTADEIREIRLELPLQVRRRFPLKGETWNDLRELASRVGWLPSEAEIARSLKASADDAFLRLGEDEERGSEKFAEQEKLDQQAAAKHPTSYPVATLHELCRRAAVEGLPARLNDDLATPNLERELADMCLNPAWDFAQGGPWYFPDLVNVLREYYGQWVAEKSEVVTTAVGRKVHETLEYTVEAGLLSLLTGNASLGQNFAARQWCEAHPGQVRYCDVPPSNDEASFYRSIARALGLGNFLNYKNLQIRERVEFVLQNGGICLVLNHAENLWPQKNLREAYPGRLAWLFEQVQKGASACMISGPQFFMQQRTCEKTGWNSPEFRKKIDHLDRLPDKLTVEDMGAIAGVMLPEAGEDIQTSIAIYAVGQERDLAALEAISKRAQFLAQRAGRTQRTAQDIKSALSFVAGSDKLLRESFTPAKSASRLRPMIAADFEPAQPVSVPADRTVGAAALPPPAFARRPDSMELVAHDHQPSSLND